MYILIHGEDNFSSRRHAKKLVDEAKNANPDFEYFSVDASVILSEELFAIFHSQLLFSPGKILFLNGFSENKNFSALSKSLTETLPTLPESIICLFWESKKLPATTTFVKFFKSNKRETLFLAPKKNAVKQETIALLEKKSIKFQEAEFLDLFLLRCNFDLNLIHNEIEKFSLLQISNIDKQTLLDLTSDNQEAIIWDLTDAISQGNRKLAVQTLERFFDMGGETFLLIPMIGRQLRIMIQVKTALDAGLDKNSIASTLKIHPFVLSKVVHDVQYISIQKIKTLFGKLLDTDFAIKTGKIDGETALSLFCSLI